MNERTSKPLPVVTVTPPARMALQPRAGRLAQADRAQTVSCVICCVPIRSGVPQ